MVEGNGRIRRNGTRERSRRERARQKRKAPGRAEPTAWDRLWVLCCRGEGALECHLLPVLPSVNWTPASQVVRGRATWLPFATRRAQICLEPCCELDPFSHCSLGLCKDALSMPVAAARLWISRGKSSERHVCTELEQGWREPRHRWQYCRREHCLGLLTMGVPAPFMLLPAPLLPGAQLQHVLGTRGQSNVRVSVHTPRRETEVCVHPPSSGQGISLVLRVP